MKYPLFKKAPLVTFAVSRWTSEVWWKYNQTPKLDNCHWKICTTGEALAWCHSGRDDVNIPPAGARDCNRHDTCCLRVCVFGYGSPQCPGGAYNEWGLVTAPRKNGTILAKEEGVVGSLGAVLTYDRR